MKKRILALLLCLVILFGCVSCGKYYSEEELENLIQSTVSEELENYLKSNSENTSSSTSSRKTVSELDKEIQDEFEPAPVLTKYNTRVYWTPNGKSYHSSKTCSALSKSKEILQGNIYDAEDAGKTDPCDRCVKQ